MVDGEEMGSLECLQDAVWKTLLRGPRPPSVRWEKPLSQSAAVTSHQPGAKRNKGCSSVKTDRKETPDAAQAAARQRVGKFEATRWRTTRRLLQSSRLL